MRELNCQDVVNPGGAAVKMPMQTSAGKVVTKSNSGVDVIGCKSGNGSVTRNCAVLYSDFSTEQQPASAGFSELCSPWQLLSVRQARNSKPGTDSRRQCEVIGSQAKAANTNSMFFNDRTTIIDSGTALSVQTKTFRPQHNIAEIQHFLSRIQPTCLHVVFL